MIVTSCAEVQTPKSTIQVGVLFAFLFKNGERRDLAYKC